MALPRIILYANSDLQSDVIAASLCKLRFTVATVTDGEELFIALGLDPEAIVLIDFAGRQNELARLIPQIQARQATAVPIFVLENSKQAALLAGVQVIPYTHRLKRAGLDIVDYLRTSTRSCVAE